MSKKKKPGKSQALLGRAGKWLAGIIGASLVGAILTFLYYWLGLSTSSTQIQPLSASVPLRVYGGGVFSHIFELADIWAAFKSPPSIGMSSQQVDAIIDHDQIITLAGHLTFYFDFESVSSQYEVVVNSIDFAITRDEPDAVTNLLFQSPMLGGGEFIPYELNLFESLPIAGQGNVKIYRAQLLSVSDEHIDYIQLQPAERESVKVDLLLDRPGKYSITPKINYSFRAKSSSVSTTPTKVLYPEWYAGWTNGRGDEPLRRAHFMINSQTGRVAFISELPALQAGCVPAAGHIALISSIGAFGFLENAYLYRFPQGELYLINPITFMFSRAGAGLTWHEHKLLMTEYDYDPVQGRRVPALIYEFDPTTMSGKTLATGESARAYEPILTAPTEIRANGALGQDWEVVLAGEKADCPTNLIVRRTDLTCETTLLSLQESCFKAVYPTP